MGPTERGSLVFKPEYVQQGEGPHLLDWAYASDTHWDAFHSNISASRDGVTISDTEGREKFGIDVRWNVEGFGYLYITADNGGEYYSLPRAGTVRTLNLNHELARSRVLRNRTRMQAHGKQGWKPSRDVSAYVALSEEHLRAAESSGKGEEARGKFAQTSLHYALWAGEMIEYEKARFDIGRMTSRPHFFMGCDARGYFQMDVELFLERFFELFDYATITHYLVAGVFEDFEPVEGKKQFALRTALFDELRKRGMTIEGRPLFWSYRTTTPDWLRKKDYDGVRRYVEDHVRTVVGHYGDGMYAWEVVNEFHDWANECQLTPDQIIEVTRLACDVARDTNPKVGRLINNCCPFAEYVQLRKWTELDAKYPQRTPWQFMKALTDAGVDFTITGQQMYFPYRDLTDTLLMVERLQEFGRPVQLTEVGASSGPSVESVQSGKLAIPTGPYEWHRPWDEETQAEWMEQLYTMAYAKPWIEAVNWYDLVDPHSWIPNGGMLRSPKGEKKAIVDRLLKLREAWKLPVHQSNK
jgi:endo-1,4-beta-xylanase